MIKPTKSTNPAFDYGEFATIRSQAGLNSYKISVKEWVEKTNAIGLANIEGMNAEFIHMALSQGDQAQAAESNRYPSDADARQQYGRATASGAEGGKAMNTERSATPLPKLTDEVATLVARVEEHLKKIGASWR